MSNINRAIYNQRRHERTQHQVRIKTKLMQPPLDLISFEVIKVHCFVLSLKNKENVCTACPFEFV